MPSIFKRLPSTQQQRAAAATSLFSDDALNTLGPNVCKALAERQVDTKRKGAKEIEELIRFYQEKEVSVAREQTTSMLNILLAEFLESSNRDIQIGGLIGVLGAAQGLQGNLKYYLGQIMVPVMQKFSETSEATLRYYAAECVYNLCLLAPAGVACLLDELLFLVFALWKDTDTRLAKPAHITDLLIRDLTIKFATQSQLISLLTIVNSEVACQPAAAPVYVIPWLELLSKKFLDTPTEFPTAPSLIAIIQLGAYALSDEEIDQLESLVERVVSFMQRQTDAQSTEALKLVEAKAVNIVKESAGASQSLLTSLVSAICGLSPSRRRIQVSSSGNLNIDEETREFVAKMAPALLPILLILLSRSGLNSEYLKALNHRIQQVVKRSPTRNLLMSDMSKILSTMLVTGKQEDNYVMVESTLQWLSYLSTNGPPLELPEDCVSIVTSLVSNDRSNIRQLAVKCVVELVQDESSLQSILNGTVGCLGEVEGSSQIMASLKMVQELLAKHNVDSINAALKAMPRTSSDQVFQYIVACYFCAYAIYASNLYLSLNDTSGWSHTPGTKLLMQSLQGKTSKIYMDPRLPGTFSLALIEAAVMLTGLPNCWESRLHPGFFVAARQLLPISSPAFLELKRYQSAPNDPSLIATETLAWSLSQTEIHLWDDKYASRLRHTLYPLIREAMSQFACEKEAVVEKETSPKVVSHGSGNTHPSKSLTGAGSTTTLLQGLRKKEGTEEWPVSHEEDVICQDTPTRGDETKAPSSGFVPVSDPATSTEDSEAREEVKEEKRTVEITIAETPVVDLPINDILNQPTLSDISTEPNSPTPPEMPKASRMLWR